jgi:acyl-CoA synthetase (AMP-forming)/AMP-acid ligase II
LLLMADLQNSRDLSSLRIIPYGAEPMPAPLLGRLRAAFPHVDFVQRFGTSETGTLPVRDEGDGLVLSPHDANYSWKVVDGELWVRSPSRALGYLSGDGSRFEAGGWFQTGDLAEVLPNGSLKIRGRRSEFINVGGEKVIPEEVEAALLRHPLVADCHVMPAPNAVLGQVVAAEVVWLGPEQKALAVKRLLHQFASTLIARHKLPAVVRLVASVQSTATLKKPRGAAR